MSERHQRAAATFVIPADVARRIHSDLDGVTDSGPVFQGLRQWLRIRLFTDQPLGMPSLTVQRALGRLCRSSDAIEEFRSSACPHRSADDVGSSFAPADADGTAMALTWALACNDERLRPDAAEHVPWLFQADSVLPEGEGWRWTIFCGHDPCRQEGFCVRHHLLPYLPASLPHQIHFNVRAPHELIDKEPHPWLRGQGPWGNKGF